MALISLQDVFLSFGEHPLFDNINLHIEQNQRICLLGRNGCGKSTLMKIMAGVLETDSGRICTDHQISISYFEQDIPASLDGLVFDSIAKGFPEHTEELKILFREEAAAHPSDDETKNSILHPADVHTPENWERLQRIQRIAADLKIDCLADFTSLSGGQKRRALLAAALVGRPDLLLLDEPTNHLDIRSITWLEEYILTFCPTVLFVTHDRSFLKRLANRIIELDRGKIYDYQCSYELFLERKQAFLEAQEKEWVNFDKKLSGEEAWLRKGIKARRTRNEGRVKALLKMREERKLRRSIQGAVKLEIGAENKSGKIVIEATDLSFSYTDKTLIKKFSTLITRGDKIGITGANGCGKTTLLNLLLGKLAPSAGTLKTGTNLSVAFFDQMRAAIHPEKSVQENVQPNGDSVTINGRNRHILSYLQDFLFSPERARSPVSQLSGGERNRLLLARLFTQPCNFLVMDEPTNDLDAETLELLEDLIVEFEGTVLIISHDRMFLNNTTSSLIVFDDNGEIIEITGGYNDWLTFKQNRDAALVENCNSKNKPASKDTDSISKTYKKEKVKRKLSFTEQKELEELPALIEGMEAGKETLFTEMASPEVYQDVQKIKVIQQELDELEVRLQTAYDRWEALEREQERLKQVQ